jgi:transposase
MDMRDGGGDRVDRARGDDTEGDGSNNDWDRMLGELAAQPIEEGWVSLDEASSATGVSRSTLRSWYRSGLIPSRMVAGLHGPQRIVPLDLVIDRALGSSRSRRQLEQARSLQAEVEELRRRIETIERHLGLD